MAKKDKDKKKKKEDSKDEGGAVFYPSNRKLKRIKQALQRYGSLSQEKPFKQEIVLIREAKSKGLEGEELIDFCYEKMGGAPKITGEEAEKEIEAEKERRERARRKASPRNKVRMKNA